MVFLKRIESGLSVPLVFFLLWFAGSGTLVCRKLTNMLLSNILRRSRYQGFESAFLLIPSRCFAPLARVAYRQRVGRQCSWDQDLKPFAFVSFPNASCN